MVFVFTQCSKTGTDAIIDNHQKAEEKVKSVDPALAWRSTAPKPGPARPIELGKYSSFELENGLKVIVVENHKLPRVSYQLTLNNDPIIEGDQAGYVSIAGDLLSTGTTSKTKAEIDAAVDFIGANLNTSSTGMFASSLKKHSEKLLDLMTDILYNPSFSKEEFEKLKKQTISGIESNKTDPNSMASNVASVLNYGKDHPYGEVVTIGTIENVTLDKAKDYYNTYFKPNNAYLIIVGDTNEAEAKANAKKYFSKWEKGNVPTPEYKSPEGPKGAKVAIANKDGAVQSVIKITYPVDLKPGSEDLVKARVMNNILGGGIFSGRLMQNLREDKAYTYGARSQLSSDDLIGNFNAYASVRNEVTDSSVHEFIYEMERLTNEPISEEDLALVKSSMTGSFGRSLESPQTMARFALNTARYNLPEDYYKTYLQRLDAVTVSDVLAMAKKYIRPDNANIIVVGSKDDISEKLLRFDTDGVIDYYDAFGNTVEMTSVMPEGVTGESVIADYIEAIGGREKIESIKTVEKNMKMSLMGQEASIVEKFMSPNLYYSKMSLAGNVMQEQKFDGTKAMMGQMGQNQIFTEGEGFEQVKSSSELFPQLFHKTNGSTITLKGVEDLNGEKTYKVEITDKTDKKSYEFYSMSSGLLLQSSSSQEGPDGSSKTITTEYGDYTEKGGVMWPYSAIISGVMPVPLNMEVVDIKVNSEMSKEDFEVE